MWADIVAWFQSPGGARVLQTAIVPALAILVAGLLAALISRAALRAALRRADRVQAATAVAGLVEAARAAAESEGGRDRRRAARLRAEADVRVRLLPLRGADRAADWAEATTEALVAARTDGAPVADVGVLRDALVAWVRRPRRARRLFAKPAALAPAPAPADRPVEAEPTSDAPSPEAPAPLERPHYSRTAAAAPDPSADDQEDVPAWRRTRSVERLHQEQTARAEAGSEPEGTAPVPVAHPHRADGPPATDEEDPAQPARHSRPAAAAEASQPRARTTPEWLDTYDDEAEVTQNLDLRTPPPVAVSAIRDRSAGADIVPRP